MPQLNAPWLKNSGDVPATLEYSNGTIFDAIYETAEKYPDYIAFDFMGSSTKYSDFVKKIKENKDFRIKVQKFVYVSKFFGWENSYIFTLNINGPYSINLAENYNNERLFEENSNEIPSFDLKNFKDFVSDKSNDFLEAASTLLYVFKNIRNSFNRNNCMDLLNDLKPHIEEDVKLNAYDEIEKFMLMDKINTSVSVNEINSKKLILHKEIHEIQETVEPFEICRNHTLILGSLEYMNVIMKIEDIDLIYKKDLLDFISFYVSRIKSILRGFEDFINLDLSIVEELFEQFQDYVSIELRIIPRVDDDNFNFADYY